MLSEVYQKLVNGLSSALVPLTSNKDNCLRIVDGHARYQDAVLQGRVYTLTTAVAGVTVGATNVYTAANPQPLVGFQNPVNSGYNAVIWTAGALWNGGTPAAGGLVWAVSRTSLGLTAVGGTGFLNNFTSASDSAMLSFINAAMTGITMTLLRSQGGPSTGALAANSNQNVIEDVAGRIIVPPGASIGLFAAAAGTSPIVNAFIEIEQQAA